MRRPVIAGNWKMNKTGPEAVELVTILKEKLSDRDTVDIVVCPPFTALIVVSSVLENGNIKLGAQNLHWKEKGAYTGELSPSMLKSAGCEYVIIGHSERRKWFGETNDGVNRKIKAAVAIQMKPIFCVGETLEEREKGMTEAVVKKQLLGGINGLSREELQYCIIAYEPVWAIGTGRTATPRQANAVHVFIRNLLSQEFDSELAQNMRIQYGGSVKPDNIASLMAESDIDGALVGGASLEAETFIKIVNYKDNEV